MSGLWPAGTLRVLRGTFPGCVGISHPGRTCRGATTDQIVRHLRKLPGTIYIPLDDRDRR